MSKRILVHKEDPLVANVLYTLTGPFSNTDDFEYPLEDIKGLNDQDLSKILEKNLIDDEYVMLYVPDEYQCISLPMESLSRNGHIMIMGKELRVINLSEEDTYQDMIKPFTFASAVQ